MKPLFRALVALLCLAAYPAFAESILPFSRVSGATAGNTVAVVANATPTSVAGSLDSTTFPANNVLVTNSGTVLVFVRMSNEATPVATAADIPLPGGTSRVLANTVPTGKTGLAVLSSTTTSATVYFTPGEGGF